MAEHFEISQEAAKALIDRRLRETFPDFYKPNPDSAPAAVESVEEIRRRFPDIWAPNEGQ